jgi:hypothetical protein
MNDVDPLPSLNFSWSWLLGSAAFDAARAVVISPGGTILVSGTTAGNFDGRVTQGETDAFLARFTRDGKKLSVTQWGSNRSESVNGIAVADDGTSFVVGYTGGNPDGLFNAGGADAFLTRFDPTGSRSWTKVWGSFDGDYAQAVALGSAGSIFAAGFTQGNLGGKMNRGDDAFVTRFDADGRQVWTRLLGTEWGDYASAIAVDTRNQQARASGAETGDRIFLAGASFGALGGAQYQGGSSDAFLLAMDSAGNSLWSRQIGTTGSDWARAVAVGAAGEIYVAGEVGGDLGGERFAGGVSDAFLRKYSASGDLEWTRLIGSAASDTANSLTVAVDGAVYIGGSSYGSLDGGANLGGDDLFVARFSPNGNRDWLWQTGTVSNDAVQALAVQAGSLILAGYSEGDFEGKSNKGLSDGFVASLAVSSPPSIERPGRSKYFVLDTPRGNLFDFGLNLPGITLRTESIELVGSREVDHARIYPGSVLDFTFSGASADKIYLPGTFDDYAKVVSGTVVTLTRGGGDSVERVSVNTSQTSAASDLLVFANGIVNSSILADYLRNPNGVSAPAPDSVETYTSPSAPATSGHALGAFVKAFALKEGGTTFAAMKPGVSLLAVGSIGVDKVYVADGTVVDTASLGASADEIYFRGTWADYTKQITSGANTFNLTRSVGGLSERVTVAAGAGALDDVLIFTNGSVSSRQALLSLQSNTEVPIQSVPGYNPSKTTPGVAVFMTESLLDNRNDLDPRSDLVLTYSSAITAQPGKNLRIVNDGGSGPNGFGFRGESVENTITIAVTDTSQVSIQGDVLIINPARDLDLANKYHIEIDEGAFKGGNGLLSAAFNGLSLLNFETVRPGFSSANPAAIATESAPSVRMTAQGKLVASQRWLDIEMLGSTSGSAAQPINLENGSFALVFKDYSDKAAGVTQGFDGVEVRGFYVSASGFGGDDLVYIDSQNTQPNDLAQSYIRTSGSAPTRLEFAADSLAPLGSALPGWIDVTLVGSTAGFNSVSDWAQRLNLSGGVLPMVSG